MHDSPLRVLLCHNRYREPGGEDHSFSAERGVLERHGHSVDIYVRDNREIASSSHTGVALRSLWNPRTYREVHALVRERGIDVVHCTNTFPLISPSVYRAARAGGATVVQGLHNYRLACPQGGFLREGRVCERCLPKRFAWPAVYHACYRGSRSASAVNAAISALHRLNGTWQNDVDLYLAPSACIRDSLLDWGLPSDRITVVPHFLENDPGHGAGSERCAVFVGRLAEEKGVRPLLAAWQSLAEPIPLRIVGTGPLSAEIERAARADPRIDPLGWRSPGETLEIIGRAACLVVPSTWQEPFGRVVIEAYARGTPVIASRAGALPELVVPERTGLLVAPNAPDELAAAVRRFFARPDAWPEMRHHCRAVFESSFSPERGYRTLRAAYENARTRKL